MALLQEILKNNKKAQGSEAQEEDKCIRETPEELNGEKIHYRPCSISFLYEQSIRRLGLNTTLTFPRKRSLVPMSYGLTLLFEKQSHI